MTETKVALVTGGNRGIGLEIARELARLGVMTALGARDYQAGLAAADKLHSEGLEPVVVELDVTSRQSIAAAVAKTHDLFGRIDILVNNAGILIDGDSSGVAGVVDVSIEKVMQTFATNTVGPLMMMQAVIPHMREQGYGRIVNMSTGLGQLSEMGAKYPAHRLSKAALNALTRTAAAELDGGTIKVNAMCPGWVRTDMGGAQAARSVEEGAQTAIWLAMLPEDGPTGGFFRDMKPIAW